MPVLLYYTMKRVVITGIGALTPLGNSMEVSWEKVTKGLSGIHHITRFDPSSYTTRIAGELKGFSPGTFIPQKDIIRLDRFVQYAAAAACMAAEDADLLAGTSSGITGRSLPEETCTFIGSSRGGITSMEIALERRLLKKKPFSAYLMSSSTISMAASYISILLGTSGPAIGISTACASGTNAIGEAFRCIQRGETALALAGGAEAPVCRMAVGGYGATGALSRRNDAPHLASRPFDRERDGFVISEGASVLVLEELSHALRRGVRIYAEISGYGTSSDAFHQTRPDPRGEALAIRRALADANASGQDVDYINAHATATPLGDSAEAGAIKLVFGPRSESIPVSSCKSMLGHMLGASGAVEAAITALSIEKGILTPTINLRNPDPDCGLHHVTSAVEREINTAISNSFGFGGVNAVLLLRSLRARP
jgi:3-oxoacyl-[acyl-carrier-protein] synthase II